MSAPLRVRSRLGKLEARAAVVATVHPYTAAFIWTERFENSSESNRDLVARVNARGREFAGNCFRGPARDTHAGHWALGLMYGVPHLWMSDTLPPPEPEVPDPDVIEALWMEFVRAAGEYQADTGELFSLSGMILREEGVRAIAERRRARAERNAAEDSASLTGLTRSAVKDGSSGPHAVAEEKAPTCVEA